jgi:hypothetical protein
MAKNTNKYYTYKNHALLEISSPKYGKKLFSLSLECVETCKVLVWRLHKAVHKDKYDNNIFYAKAHIYKKGKRTVVQLHRYLLNEPPCIVDHINCFTQDNRLSNLRVATTQQNSANKSRVRVNPVTGNSLPSNVNVINRPSKGKNYYYLLVQVQIRENSRKKCILGVNPKTGKHYFNIKDEEGAIKEALRLVKEYF